MEPVGIFFLSTLNVSYVRLELVSLTWLKVVFLTAVSVHISELTLFRNPMEGLQIYWYRRAIHFK